MMKHFISGCFALILMVAVAQAQAPVTAPAARQPRLLPRRGDQPRRLQLPPRQHHRYLGPTRIHGFPGALLESNAGKCAQAEFIKQIGTRKDQIREGAE
jgi:hypothetical protein